MTSTQERIKLSTIRDLVRPLAPAATLYVGLRPEDPMVDPARDLALRWRAIAGRLALLGAPESTVAVMGERVASAPVSPAGLAIVARGEDVLFCQRIPGEVHFDRAGYSAPPHVVPLLSWLQRHPPLVSVCAERGGGEIKAVPSGAADGYTRAVPGPDDEIERNAPGGWSQPRYQRRAEDSWRHNAAAVASAAIEASREVGARLLLLGGDVRAAQLVRDRLADYDRVLVRSVPRTPGAPAPHDAADEVSGYVNSETAALLDEFDAERHPRGLAVEGVTNTLAALAAGRARILFITDDPTDRRTAWFGPQTLCVDDSSRGGMTGLRPGRLVDVAVRAALLTGAGVRVIDAGSERTPLPAEAIGALCRFPPP